ncbi:major facilitator superfamily domain-containing protein [Lasiosphaeria miniovina]|uniref:Major facilitator superfamily domain-containing protein n=1 Tax=Lasiosphaeria miniovina TaxID=1954250 RepID=A0AA40DNP4_9PEZI|nr:major facilitator superfamily domain-containing protein [Lasiosphaeria miniovina]KAK0709895.1 major facilitator superfamily domain-containing protein [Lasiosphaeria miniovina]
MADTKTSSIDVDDPKVPTNTTGESKNDTHFAAERGHVATDQHGHSLVHIDPKVEARLRWKIDLYVVPTVALLYLFCFIDRANVGNAKIAFLERDLGMAGYDYNALLSVFYISYIVFEIPSNIMCKWVGPGWFIPGISLGFGICSLATAFVQTKAQASGVRFLLGIFEAGMMPGIAYYLSRWYRRAELTFRLSLYIVMAPLAGAFGGLLASGILSLDHVGSVRGWRMIFLVEGIITIGLSVIAFFTLTDRPATARWLTAEEQDMAIARVKAERVTTTEVLDAMNVKKLLKGMANPVTFSTALIFLLNNITVQGLAFFLPTIVKTIYPDKSTVTQQLYTVPPYIVGAFFTLLLPLISTLADRRQVFMILSAPTVMIGYIMFLAVDKPQVRYGATFLITSTVYALGPITNSQVSANVISDTSRTSAIALNVMLGNIGGLVSTWSFLPWDAPNYHIGNGLNLATSGTVLVISTLALLWMKQDNRKRESRSVEEELAGLSQQQVQDLDYKNPAFRWHP